MSQCNLFLGDCLEKLKELDDCSVDSIVTDPPYGISFMGNSWDYSVPSVDIWKECLRVLKPGGHLLSFSGSRTYHRMTVNIEDAGFEIRDQIMWVYGSGFPKSLNVGKALDKKGIDNNLHYLGTALKPSHEPIVMARKPFKGDVASNVLEYGTGAINIDDCRVGDDEISTHNAPKGTFAGGEENRGSDTSSYTTHIGRYPANFIHDGSDEVLRLFPDTGGGSFKFNPNRDRGNTPFFEKKDSDLSGRNAPDNYGDKGSAARYFYCAKASKRDRNEGCEDLEEKQNVFNGKSDKDCPSGNISGSVANKFKTQPKQNNHPTVKPTELMRYLCRLVTPKDGIVLDPFMGSGSTGKAAILEGFSFVGIELSEEYFNIAKRRVKII